MRRLHAPRSDGFGHEFYVVHFPFDLRGKRSIGVITGSRPPRAAAAPAIGSPGAVGGGSGRSLPRNWRTTHE